MKIVVLELMRHEWMMPLHGSVEGMTEQMGPLLDLGGKRHEIFGGDETQLAADRLIHQYLRLEGVQLSHQGDNEEMDPHSTRSIGNLTRRTRLWVFDTPHG